MAKLKRDFDLPFMELNNCAAHSFALVGSQAGLVKEGINYLALYIIKQVVL